ncbi:MAG: CinA family protein [Clostridia bacterium]|nr:CinA family protein [Clostridia bacterium]
MVDYLSCLDKALVETLKNNGLTVTTAESCTGGMVASSIVNISGASQVFKEGYITYSNEAKERILGVKRETLEQFTAVSEETAKQMAEGAVRITGADISVSVTGVAGPLKEDDKPVGLVYIGCCYKGQVYVKKCELSGDRHTIRCQSTKEALKFVLDVLKTH